MKAPTDGWDDDERDVLESAELAQQLEAVRARHALDAWGEARLLTRIRREGQASGKPVRTSLPWTAWLAAAGVLLIAGSAWVVRRNPAPEPVTPPQQAVATATPSPTLYLALEKPAIKISPTTLAWRGPVARDQNPLLADLKPGFDAFRADDYARADREFSAIAARYPASVEIAFHQGVARLFLGNAQGAVESLAAAERLGDSAFAWDVAWYRAVAEERTGNLSQARTRLTGLCALPDARAKTACDALGRLPGGRPPAP